MTAAPRPAAPKVVPPGVGGWQDISTAPKDRSILVAYDHDADPYVQPNGDLTDYAAWAEGGDYLSGKGVCIARWFPQFWEPIDEYSSHWMPACWFAAEYDDFARAVNPILWLPYDDPPTGE